MTVIQGGTEYQGWVQSVGTDWTATRAGGALTSWEATGEAGTWSAGTTPNAPSSGQFTCKEGFDSFDTSTIPADATVTFMRVRLQHTGAVIGTELHIRLLDYGTHVTTDDWVPGADLAALPLLAHVVVASDYGNDWLVIDDWPAHLNRSGTTRVIIHDAQMLSTDTPGASSLISGAMFMEAWWEPEVVATALGYGSDGVVGHGYFTQTLPSAPETADLEGLRTGPPGDLSYDTIAALWVDQGWAEETFVDFDTSALDIPDGAEVSGTYLDVGNATFNTAAEEPYAPAPVDIEVRLLNYGTLTTDDWVAGADLGSLPLVAHGTAASAGHEYDEYVRLTDDGLGPLLNLAGHTQLIVTTAGMAADVDDANGVQIAGLVNTPGAQSPSSTQPKLLFAYSFATGGGPEEHTGSFAASGHGVIIESAQKGAQVGLSASGHGVAPEVETTTRLGASASSGHGTVAEAAATQRLYHVHITTYDDLPVTVHGRKGAQLAMTASGHGTMTEAETTARAGAFSATGEGVATVGKQKVAQGSASASGGGTAPLTETTGRLAAWAGSGSGTFSEVETTARAGAFAVTGEGVVVVTAVAGTATARSGFFNVGGSGGVTFSAETVRASSMTASGHGSVTFTDQTARASTFTVTGSGGATVNAPYVPLITWGGPGLHTTPQEPSPEELKRERERKRRQRAERRRIDRAIALAMVALADQRRQREEEWLLGLTTDEEYGRA